MNNLAVKEVNFNGDNLIVAHDSDDGKVYVGVKWICDGLGLSKGKMQNERLKIQEDLVLSKGERNLVLPTKGGNQEVQCIELDFLPLWLAKISITPTMKKESPELVQKLIDYQLKAKDVLAAVFIHKDKNKVNDIIDTLANKNDIELLFQKQIAPLIEQNNILTSKVNFLEDKLNKQSQTIEMTIDNQINKYLPVKIYMNPSTQFEDLLNKFYIVQNLEIPGNGHKYGKFYKVLEQWIGYKLPSDSELIKLGYKNYGDKGNMKQYLLTNKWNTVEELLYKISTGQIVKSQEGYWIDLNGFRSNDIEYNRIMREFDHCCAYCGASGQLYPEHIIPQSNPKSTDCIYNIIPACKSCNEDKLGQKASDWFRKQSFWTEERHEKIADHINRYKVVKKID